MSYHTCGWQEIPRSLTAQAPNPFTLFGLYHLSPPHSFFLNSPPLGQADRPARHEPRSLIQGEPVTHPLRHTGINCELGGSVPRQGAPECLPSLTRSSLPRASTDRPPPPTSAHHSALSQPTITCPPYFSPSRNWSSILKVVTS